MKTLFPIFPNPAASHNLILFPFHALSLTPQPHISSSQSHSLNHSVSALSLTVSHGHKPTSSQAQAVRRRSHTVATLSQAYSSLLSQVSTPFGLTVADLTVAQPSSVFPSHLPRPWPHGLAPPRSPFFFFSGFSSSQILNMSLCL